MVGVRVDVEQPRVRRERVADRVDRRRSRPSLKFGTDSSGSTRLLYKWMKEYYDLRAPYYDDWWIGAARERPAGWQAGARPRRSPRSRPFPAARTLDVACGAGFLAHTSPATSSGWIRAHACSPRRAVDSRCERRAG